MKTTNYILPLAAFAAGALFAKSQSGVVSGIGAFQDDFDVLVEKVAEDTHYNDHTEAIIKIAKYFKQKSIAEQLKHIEAISRIEGSMPTELSIYRSVLLNRLQSLAKELLNDKNYEALMRSL